MTEEGRKGIYIPESIWKILQSVLLAMMIGAYGMMWAHETEITTLRLQFQSQEQKIEELEAELDAQDVVLDTISTSVIEIKTELPHIRSGIDELKTLMRPPR